VAKARFWGIYLALIGIAIAIAVVALGAALLLRRALRGRRAGACGCEQCPAKKRTS